MSNRMIFLFIITNEIFLNDVLLIYDTNKLCFDKANLKVLANKQMMPKIKETQLNYFLSNYDYVDILPDMLDQLNQTYSLYFATPDEIEWKYMNDVVNIYPVEHWIAKLESN